MNDPAKSNPQSRKLDAVSSETSDAVRTFGNADAWVCLCKASKPGAWMKSTKAFETPSGCVLQVTTLEISEDGARRPAEAITYMPGVSMTVLKAAFE